MWTTNEITYRMFVRKIGYMPERKSKSEKSISRIYK
jgi:hypothetical protein